MLTTGLLAAAAGGIYARRLGASVAAFPIFDALLFRGKPNLAHQGLLPMLMVFEVWRRGMPRDRVDREGIIAALDTLPPDAGTVFIDIENWPLQGSAEVKSQSVDKYLRTAEIIRTHRPSIKFGFYGIAPSFAYWPIVRDDKQQLAEWRSVNRDLLSLKNSVDFVLPCLYTPYDDPPAWRQFAKRTLEEARQYGKPVYPFLWNEYFDANPLLRGQQVNNGDWRDELQLCLKLADGIVLWGGSERGWSESAEWWQSVLAFQHRLLQ
jgi:hypothetical protein